MLNTGQQRPCLQLSHHAAFHKFSALFQHLSNNNNNKKYTPTVWQALLLGMQTAFSSHTSMLITQQNAQDPEQLEIQPKVKFHIDFKRKPPR